MMLQLLFRIQRETGYFTVGHAAQKMGPTSKISYEACAEGTYLRAFFLAIRFFKTFKANDLNQPSINRIFAL